MVLHRFGSVANHRYFSVPGLVGLVWPFLETVRLIYCRRARITLYVDCDSMARPDWCNVNVEIKVEWSRYIYLGFDGINLGLI